MGKNIKTHRFFCIKCSGEGIPLPRKQGHKHERFHRKKLYCIHCRAYSNHIECKNDEEVYEFKENYKKGLFIEEAKQTEIYLRGQIFSN